MALMPTELADGACTLGRASQYTLCCREATDQLRAGLLARHKHHHDDDAPVGTSYSTCLLGSYPL